MPDGLDDIQSRLRKFVAERDWDQFHDPKNLAMAVASEAGELVAEYRWIDNAQSDAWSAEQDNKRRVALEAADVCIALLLLCERVDVDLVEAMRVKIALNAKNYPVAETKGRHSRPGSPPDRDE